MIWELPRKLFSKAIYHIADQRKTAPAPSSVRKKHMCESNISDNALLSIICCWILCSLNLSEWNEIEINSKKCRIDCVVIMLYEHYDINFVWTDATGRNQLSGTKSQYLNCSWQMGELFQLTFVSVCISVCVFCLHFVWSLSEQLLTCCSNWDCSRTEESWRNVWLFFFCIGLKLNWILTIGQSPQCQFFSLLMMFFSYASSLSFFPSLCGCQSSWWWWRCQPTLGLTTQSLVEHYYSSTLLFSYAILFFVFVVVVVSAENTLEKKCRISVITHSRVYPYAAKVDSNSQKSIVRGAFQMLPYGTKRNHMWYIYIDP